MGNNLTTGLEFIKWNVIIVSLLSTYDSLFQLSYSPLVAFLLALRFLLTVRES